MNFKKKTAIEPAAQEWNELQKWVQNQLLPVVNAGAVAGGVRALHEALYRQGWINAGFEGLAQGNALKLVDLAAAARSIGYGSAGIAISSTVNWMAQFVIHNYAKKYISQSVFEKCAKKMSFFSFCMTEPNAGTDVARIETRAVWEKDRFFLSGQKCFITNFDCADHLIVFAKAIFPSHSPHWNQGKEQITAFYVPGDAVGLTRGRALSKLGLRESSTGELFFDRVELREDWILGEVGQGFSVLASGIQRSKTMISSIAVGVGDRIFDLLKDYLSGREHYGRRLLDLPTIRCQIAEHQTEMQAAWLLTEHAALTLDAQKPAAKEASMAKDYASHVTFRFASEALELFGGYGYTEEYEIERLFRDARVFEILEGASLVQKTLIAKELFGAGVEKAVTVQTAAHRGLRKAA